MENFQILREFVIILAVSIPVAFIFQKIKFPSIVGFIIAGVLIGPGGFKLISDISSVNMFAEIGVILLLFSIGLEFSLSKLISIGRLLFLGGALQVFLSAGLVGGVVYFFTKNIALSILYGFLVSLSSTAIVLKSFADRNEEDSPYGNISLGILLFQDLFVIPLVVAVPFLKNIENFQIVPLIKALLFSIIVLIAIYFTGSFALNRIMHYIVKLKNRELFTLTVVAGCLGTAYLSYSMGGISLSIGAFIAGLILSKSDYSHQVISDIIPFKDCFNSVFFVSIGMLLSTQFLFENIFSIFGGTLLIMILKIMVIIPIVLYFKYPLRIAIIVGLCLSEIGEFSFILGKFGNELNIIATKDYEYFIAIAVVSMIISPFLIIAAPGFSLFLQKILKLPLSEDRNSDKKDAHENHVIIIGYGLNGKNLSRVLHETGIKHIIVDLDIEKITEAKADGDLTVFGDFTKKEVLECAGIKNAKVAVIAISDPTATQHGLWRIKEINPTIYTIVRTRSNVDVPELVKLGANEVIPEEFETSIEIFSRVLSRFHVPRNVIEQQMSIIRKGNYGMLRTTSLLPSKLMDLDDILNLTLTETILIKNSSKAVGKTLTEINLRVETGTTVIAVVRGGKAATNPKSEFVVAENDVIVLLGNHAELDKAVQFIASLEG
ncbi:cation:proton antiporter [Candidatus Desantisbacteria bacterium]|nr:cation:proton antiporter [Candidatus Desantisbacteria bacterium]